MNASYSFAFSLITSPPSLTEMMSSASRSIRDSNASQVGTSLIRPIEMPALQMP